MEGSQRKILALLLALCFGLVFVLVRSSGTHNPTLTVTLLTSTNIAGSWIARFAVTNVGNATLVNYGIGEIRCLRRNHCRM